jgi:hypothetical protein
MSHAQPSVVARQLGNVIIALGLALLVLSTFGIYKNCGGTRCAPGAACAEPAYLTAGIVVFGGGIGLLLLAAGFLFRFFANRHVKKLGPADTKTR